MLGMIGLQCIAHFSSSPNNLLLINDERSVAPSPHTQPEHTDQARDILIPHYH
jgi:hypothetical protein